MCRHRQHVGRWRTTTELLGILLWHACLCKNLSSRAGVLSFSGGLTATLTFRWFSTRIPMQRIFLLSTSIFLSETVLDEQELLCVFEKQRAFVLVRLFRQDPSSFPKNFAYTIFSVGHYVGYSSIFVLFSFLINRTLENLLLLNYCRLIV